MAGGVINLGQVAFVDKGIYSNTVTYKRFNFIVTDDSCYLSLKDDNTGHAVTDTTWWKCLAKGSQATEAARKALEAMNNCNDVIIRAEAVIVKTGKAETNANAAASNANAVIEDSQATLLKTTDALNTMNGLLPELRSAIQTAVNAYNLVSQIDGVDVFSSLPATIVVETVTGAVIGSTPIIKTKLFPLTANQSVVFQTAKGGGFVNPSGVVSSPTAAGEMVVYAVSTQQSNVWKEIKIKFRSPVSRTTENGTARTTENGVAIEC